MPRRLTLHAEPSHVRITGSDAHGLHGSTFTGRRIDVEGGYRDAMAWLESYQIASPADAEFADRFLADLTHVRPSAVSRPFFRGRRAGLGVPPSFGPPPEEDVAAGRYNESGQAVLYLCSQVDAIRLEVPDRDGGRLLWAGTFVLPPERLVADLTVLPESSLVSASFFFAERARDDDREEVGYGFARALARLVSTRFNGMLVPGVRGSDTLRYSNLILFRPTNWRRWFVEDSPVCLDRSASQEAREPGATNTLIEASSRRHAAYAPDVRQLGQAHWEVPWNS